MTQTFHRDRVTWLAYLLLAFYGYFLNSLGPITPFLKDELRLSYTVSSLHFTAFAAGILLVGLIGHPVIRRLGQRRSLWLGALGISVGALVLVAAPTVALTIAASFCMGLIGSLILATVPAVLSQQHGGLRAIAYSEANLVASLVSTIAPLMVGWAAHLPGSWRWALGLVAVAPWAAAPWLGRVVPGSARPAEAPGGAGPDAAAAPSAAGAAGAPAAPDPAPSARRLPRLYWVFWVALFFAVSLEFCMISWSAGYLATGLGMQKANAAQALSLFLAGMVGGRLAGSRLVRRFSSHQVVIASIGVAAVGFGLFWAAPSVPPALAGLFLTGLGIASLYPLLLSMAIGVTENSVQAGARATLASGAAVLVLPLVLGRLADMIGIRPAYGVVAVLLLCILVIVLVARQLPRP